MLINSWKRAATCVQSRLAVLLFVAVGSDAASNSFKSVDPTDVYWTWIEKYLTYEQKQDGRLVMTDASLLAEVIYSARRKIEKGDAALFLNGDRTPLARFSRTDPFAFTNGEFYTRKSKSYDDIAALEAAIAPDARFVWEIDKGGQRVRLEPIRIGGAQSMTQYPEPSPLYLSQAGLSVNDNSGIDPRLPLRVRWNAFSKGGQLEGSKWEDVIFLMLSDCHGEVQYTSGAPEQGDGFADYRATSGIIPAAALEPGMEYVLFLTFIKYVDYNAKAGIEQFAANSTAVELPIRTTGLVTAARNCPDPVVKAPYLWTEKTPTNEGLVPWPAFVQ